MSHNVTSGLVTAPTIIIHNDAGHDSSVAELCALQLTQFKSFGGFNYGLTVPSQKLLRFVFSAEELFCSCRNDCVHSSDAKKTLLKRSTVLFNDPSIPQCHSLAQKILNKFFSKSRLVLTFLVFPFWNLLTRVVPDIFQKSSKMVVCVVCVQSKTACVLQANQQRFS